MQTQGEWEVSHEGAGLRMFRGLGPSLLPAQRTLCRAVAAPLLPARPSRRVATISSKQPATTGLPGLHSHQQRQSLTLSLGIPASGTRADGPGAVRPGAPWVTHRQNPGAAGGAVTSLGTQPLGDNPPPLGTAPSSAAPVTSCGRSYLRPWKPPSVRTPTAQASGPASSQCPITRLNK